MLDSSGKINAGIFNGNLAAYGNFEECMDIETKPMNFPVPNQNLDIQVPAFKGQYVLTSIVIPQSNGQRKLSSSPYLRHHLDYGTDLGINNTIQLDFVLVRTNHYYYGHANSNYLFLIREMSVLSGFSLKTSENIFCAPNEGLFECKFELPTSIALEL